MIFELDLLQNFLTDFHDFDGSQVNLLHLNVVLNCDDFGTGGVYFSEVLKVSGVLLHRGLSKNGSLVGLCELLKELDCKFKNVNLELKRSWA